MTYHFELGLLFKMAGGDKILFPHEISSYNALDWSEDGTVAIATDNGVLLLVNCLSKCLYSFLLKDLYSYSESRA